MPHNVIIINSERGYPSPIAVSRYTKDVRDAADVRRLVGAVVGCSTDGLLHYTEHGTHILLQIPAQTRLWSQQGCDTAPLTSLIPLLNRWMQQRTEILKGKRAVEMRSAKSDAEINELGYPDLRRALLSLADRKHKRLQILDAAGHGGFLDIPPRAHLIPARKIDEPAQPDGATEVLHIEFITQVIDPSGTLIEAPSARVSSDVVEGRHVCVRHPHKASVRSRRAQHVNVIQQDQEQRNEEK